MGGIMELLPHNINCPNCGVELVLDSSERRNRKFFCPNCNSNLDLSRDNSSYEITENVFKANFMGSGGDLFGIYFITGLITLGIFFALVIFLMISATIFSNFKTLNLIVFWSLYGLMLCIIYAYYKLKTLDFFYSKCEFFSSYLMFRGTYKEIFMGILKAIPILIGFFITIALFETQIAAKPYLIFVIYAGFFIIAFLFIQYAYFSSRRYRFSRIFYNDKNFVFKGNMNECVKKSMINGLISIITLGIYLPIYFHQRFSMLYNNLYYGEIPFCYEGDDKEFFKIALEGFFLTVLTFGIYYFWWKPKRYNYYMQNLYLDNAYFHSEIKPKELFNLIIPNWLLIVFTFGLGQAWAKVREARFFVSATFIRGSLPSADHIESEAGQKVEATGEALADYFGLGGVGMF
jgi:uncharacterized membrane protein YjgN (DUF898 family)